MRRIAAVPFRQANRNEYEQQSADDVVRIATWNDVLILETLVARSLRNDLTVRRGRN